MKYEKKNNGMLAVIALLLCLVTMLTACRKNEPKGTEPEATGSVETTAGTEETTVPTEGTEPTNETIEVTEPAPESTTAPVVEDNDEGTQATEPRPPVVDVPVVNNPTPPSGNTGTSTPPVNNPPSTPALPTTSAPGAANTSTGISWDGVSPIIYTYPDGTTGTTPMVGATYESRPGITSTYTGYVMGSIGTGIVDGEVYCSQCGKISKDGANGTCIRWLAGSTHVCGGCGATVNTGDCHTCG